MVSTIQYTDLLGEVEEWRHVGVTLVRVRHHEGELVVHGEHVLVRQLGASSEYQRNCSSYPHLTAFMKVSTAAFREMMRNFRPSPWAGRPLRKAAMSVDPLDMMI